VPEEKSDDFSEKVKRNQRQSVGNKTELLQRVLKLQ
jgi:hypothetical protein